MNKFVYENCTLKGIHVTEHYQALQSKLAIALQLSLERELDNRVDKLSLSERIFSIFSSAFQ